MAIQKVCHLHFLPHSILSHFVNFTLSFPLWKKKKRMREKKIFAYMAASAYHVMSKEVKNDMFWQDWIFRHTCMYKEPTLMVHLFVWRLVAKLCGICLREWYLNAKLSRIHLYQTFKNKKKASQIFAIFCKYSYLQRFLPKVTKDVYFS